jgi:hypothetical protein
MEKISCIWVAKFCTRKKCWVFSLLAFTLQQIKREQLSVTYSKAVVAPILFLCNQKQRNCSSLLKGMNVPTHCFLGGIV